MNALKIITTIALGILLSIFLNNTMAFMFSGAQKIGGERDVYSYCYKQFPRPSRGTDTLTDEQRKVEDEVTNKQRQCEEENQVKFSDQKIHEKQAIIIRSVVVLMILVTISAAIFRRYPFYASSLIFGGILFLITYYIYETSGGYLGSSYEYEKASAAAINQLKLTKFVVTMIGFVGLSIADLLFFEKERMVRHSPDQHSS